MSHCDINVAVIFRQTGEYRHQKVFVRKNNGSMMSIVFCNIRQFHPIIVK